MSLEYELCEKVLIHHPRPFPNQYALNYFLILSIGMIVAGNHRISFYEKIMAGLAVECIILRRTFV